MDLTILPTLGLIYVVVALEKLTSLGVGLALRRLTWQEARRRWVAFLYCRWLRHFLPYRPSSVWYRAWQGGDWYKIRPWNTLGLLDEGIWVGALPEGLDNYVLVAEEHYDDLPEV
jgi:hypothetical protein